MIFIYRILKVLMPAVFLLCALGQFSTAEKLKEMQEIYFYARKYYDEGKYERAIKEFNRILELSPGHGESARMISLCNEKIALTSDLVNQAMEYYNKGDLEKSLELLDKAGHRDVKNFKITSLTIKILTELGVGYSIVGNHSTALKYLQRASVLSPEDTKIRELIDISKSMVGEDTPHEDTSDIKTRSLESEHEKLERMIETFNKYQEKQHKILEKYFQAHEKLQKMMDSAEKEKQRLYEALKKRENMLEDILSKQESQTKEMLGKLQKNLYIFGVSGLAVLLTGLGIIRMRSSKLEKERQKLQEDLVKSLEHIHDPKAGMSEYEKKLKKIEIIEKELTAKNHNENQMALGMLRSFLIDKDRRVELEAVKVLHRINPKAAVTHMKVLLKKEKSSALRIEACRKLGEMVSKESINFLFNLTQSKREDIKRTAFSSLTGILDRNAISGTYRLKVKEKLQEISKKERWVIS